MITKRRFTISMDKALVDTLDVKVEEGRYPNRSEAIETCVKQVFKMEESDSRVMDLTIELMELAVKSPEFFERFKEIMKEQGG